AGEVDDGLGLRDRLAKTVGRRGQPDLGSEQAARPALGAHPRRHLVAGSAQPRGQLPADKSGSPRNEYLHRSPPGPGVDSTPMSRYLISRYSTIPYFDPSRPIPDCFTPPNGATSVEMIPSLIPTIPYSSPSATRQIRPISRL